MRPLLLSHGKFIDLENAIRQLTIRRKRICRRLLPAGAAATGLLSGDSGKVILRLPEDPSVHALFFYRVRPMCRSDTMYV